MLFLSSDGEKDCVVLTEEDVQQMIDKSMKDQFEMYGFSHEKIGVSEIRTGMVIVRWYGKFLRILGETFMKISAAGVVGGIIAAIVLLITNYILKVTNGSGQ